MGIGVAAATGGAAAPFALAGCGLGRAAGKDESTCGEANCDASSRAALELTLARHQLPGLPMCGGTMGITLHAVPGRGLAIEGVVHESSASRMGIVPGDVLLSVEGRRVADASALARAIASVAEGEPLRAVVYREGRRVELASHRIGSVLGVQHRDAIVEVPNAQVRVAQVQGGTGAEAAGLARGDMLVSVGDYADVSEADAVHSAVRLVEEGADVPVIYTRAGRRHETRVVLGPRNDPYAL